MNILKRFWNWFTGKDLPSSVKRYSSVGDAELTFVEKIVVKPKKSPKKESIEEWRAQHQREVKVPHRNPSRFFAGKGRGQHPTYRRSIYSKNIDMEEEN